jgi:hypothetical protein
MSMRPDVAPRCQFIRLSPGYLDVHDTVTEMTRLPYKWINRHLGATARHLNFTFKNEPLGIEISPIDIIIFYDCLKKVIKECYKSHKHQSSYENEKIQLFDGLDSYVSTPKIYSINYWNMSRFSTENRW